MSAIVVLRDEEPIDQAEQEQFVLKGLEAMSGRASGEIRIVRGDRHAVLGQSKSRALAGIGWSGSGLARQQAGENAVLLAVSGFIDNADEIGGKLGIDRDACEASVARLLLGAYLANGPSFAEQVGGAFAIAVFDGRTGELHLVRDRLGIEPLYYWHSARFGRIAAASEPKAILQDPRFPRVFDESAILDLMNSTSRIPGTTVYKYLAEVRPGEIVTFRDGRIWRRRYWTLPERAGAPAGEKAAAEQIAALLDDAVRRRLHDVGRAQAFLLSGGLDSSVICAAARHTAGKEAELQTFSFSYAGEDTDFRPDALHHSLDGPYVEIMRDHIGSRHETIVIEPGDVRAALEDTVRARDLPGVGDLDITLLHLYRRIRETGREEVFSGEGADDLFGGFPWIAAEAQSPGHTFPWLKGTGAANFLHPELRARCDLDEQLRQRWKAAESEMPGLRDEDPLQRHMDYVFYMQLTRFLPFLLDRADRMSAAAGLRVQLPFLDHRLVEFAWNLPYNIKRTGSAEKGILRKAYEHRLPYEVAWRKKSGFAVMRNRPYTSAVLQYLREAANDQNSVLPQIADIEYLRTFMTRSEWSDGTFDAPPILPRLVMLDMWTRLYGVKFESSHAVHAG